jgi:hypothetical protein
VLMGKEIPCIAVGAVVLAHGAPCPLAQVWAPTPPGRPTLGDLQQAVTFCRHGY